MACLDQIPELNILGSWNFPPLIAGFVPLMWTTGSYDPLAQDGNPWFGLVVPDNFSWYGSTLEIKYFSGGVQYGGCYVTFPPVTVKIHQSCTSGFHQFFIEVIAGNRKFSRNLWNTPGSWKLTNSVLTHDNSVICADKFLKGGSIKEMDLRFFWDWVSLMRDNSVASSGIAPAWFSYIAENRQELTGLKEVCEGCFYGLVPKPLPSNVQPLSTVLNGLLKVSFPVSEADLPAYVSTCANGAMVIEQDLSYRVYMQLKQNCDSAPWLIAGEGLLSTSCIVAEVQKELPADSDPRWTPKCPKSSSCSRVLRNGARNGQISLFNEGVFEGSFSPVETITPFNFYEGNFIQEGRCWQVIDTTTIQSSSEAGACTTRRFTTVTTIVARVVRVAQRINGQWVDLATDPSEEGQAIIAAYGGNVCRPIDKLAPRPNPIPRLDRNDKDKDKGNCYVKGVISVGILGSMTKKIRFGSDGTLDRAYNVVAPVIRGKALSVSGIPSSIDIPFMFRLPTGQTNIGGVSVNVIGTALIAVTINNDVDRQLLINLEELFAFYNFAQSVLSFLVPGKVDITDLEGFCE